MRIVAPILKQTERKNVGHVKCHMSHVIRHMSGVICHMMHVFVSHVTCNLSPTPTATAIDPPPFLLPNYAQ